MPTLAYSYLEFQVFSHTIKVVIEWEKWCSGRFISCVCGFVHRFLIIWFFFVVLNSPSLSDDHLVFPTCFMIPGSGLFVRMLTLNLRYLEVHMLFQSGVPRTGSKSPGDSAKFWKLFPNQFAKQLPDPFKNLCLNLFQNKFLKFKPTLRHSRVLWCVKI